MAKRHITIQHECLSETLWRNGNIARLYLYLLHKACEPVSYREAAHETGLTLGQVRSAIRKLNTSGLIADIKIQKTTRVSTQIELSGVGINGKSRVQPKPQAKRTKFIPPTEQEVREYVLEKGYHFNPESFVPHYQSKGWKVGSEPMKDWKAACCTWETSWKTKHGQKYYYELARNKRATDGRQTDRYSNLENAAYGVALYGLAGCQSAEDDKG